MRTVCLIAICLLATGCGNTRYALDLPMDRANLRHAFKAIPGNITDEGQMIEAVRALIPNGTPIAEAERLMRRQGFQCSPLVNASFTTSDRVDHQERTGLNVDHKERIGLDYVACVRDERAGFLVSRRWCVALVQRDGEVVEVLARRKFTGP